MGANPIDVILESGRKKTFASAADWLGWARSGTDEVSALQALVDYGPRYDQVLQLRDLKLQPPKDRSELIVTERHPGNATTDFGAPAAIPNTDNEPLNLPELERLGSILLACWDAFDIIIQRAAGMELRKGPRGGGRDVDKIIHHVIEADRAYLRRLAWKTNSVAGVDLYEVLKRTRQAVLSALDKAVTEGLPERGPRGGIIWTPRYFIRRSAWHVLDHVWEIEDRNV